MIEIIETVPENVAAFRASGHVTKEQYDTVLIPAVDEHVKKFGKINFLLVLDNKITDFTIAALLDDIAVGLKHFIKWHKMAIVSESAGINKFTDLFSYIAPGQSKGFTHAQMNEAIAWVST